jgi:hypothetical protein
MDLRFPYSSEKFSTNCCWSTMPLRLIIFIPLPWKDVHNQHVVQCHPSSIWPPVLLLNPTHTLLILLRLFAVTVACRGSFHSKFKISCPFSFTLAVPKRHSHLDILCNVSQHAGFVGWGVVSPSHNTEPGGSPLVSCPRLLIHYCHGYCQYLEAVTSLRRLSIRLAMVAGKHLEWLQLSKHRNDVDKQKNSKTFANICTLY